MDNEFKKLIGKILKVSSDFDEIERESLPSWDSMKHAEMIIKLQSTFGIKFELADVMEITKVSEFYSLILKKKNQK